MISLVHVLPRPNGYEVRLIEHRNCYEEAFSWDYDVAMHDPMIRGHCFVRESAADVFAAVIVTTIGATDGPPYKPSVSAASLCHLISGLA